MEITINIFGGIIAMTTDKTLEQACQNPDGKNYNGVKLMQWLYEITTGKPIEATEIEQMWKDAKKKHDSRKLQKNLDQP